jgi:hypothetical protein
MKITMIQREWIAKTMPTDFVHVVTGEWATKTVHIDGELVTVAMLRERVLEEEQAMTDACSDSDYHGAWGLDLREAESFDWGSRSDGASLLSLAWIFWFGGIDLHDWVFKQEIERLPCTDFTHHYPRTRLEQDLQEGEAMFAADFHRGMDEMGFERLD